MGDDYDEWQEKMERERLEEELFQETYGEPLSDDGCGPHDSSEGCSYCGFWQCSGCNG